MSEFKVTNISNVNNDSGPIISGISTISGSGYIKLPIGKEEQKVGIESGALRYNSNFNVIEFYDGTEWKYLSESSSHSSSMGIFFGGYFDYYTTPSTNIDYISISNTGNASKFGDLETPRNYASGCSSSTRGIIHGGANSLSGAHPTGVYLNTISYITYSTKGKSLPFGQMLESKHVGPGNAGCGSETRGIIPGGYGSIVGNTNTIEYVTIASKGNSLDFGGDLTVARYGPGAFSSTTRGVFASGWNSLVIDYITIASTGVNATDWGAASAYSGKYGIGACSSSTRGVFSGYYGGYSLYIEYVTIASAGSVSVFGRLKRDRIGTQACSSKLRGVWGGGYNSEYQTANEINMEYITIATTGNAEYFGDLTTHLNVGGGISNNHGGI